MRRIFLIVLMAVWVSGTLAQMHSNCIEQSDLSLRKDWLYLDGFEHTWIKNGIPISQARPIEPARQLEALSKLSSGKIYSLFIDLQVLDSCDLSQYLSIKQTCASRIYLDGNLLATFGNLGQQSSEIRAFDPMYQPVLLPSMSLGKHQLLIVFGLQQHLRPRSMFGSLFPLFDAKILSHPLAMDHYANRMATGMEYFHMGIILLIFLVHFLSFLVNPTSKLQGWFCLYALFMLFNLIPGFTIHIPDWVDNKIHSLVYKTIMRLLAQFFLIITYLEILKPISRKWVIPFFAAYVSASINDWFIPIQQRQTIDLILESVGPGLMAFLAYSKLKSGSPSARYLFWGTVLHLIFWIVFLFSVPFKAPPIWIEIIFYISILCIPLSISMVLSQNFRFINQALEKETLEKEKLIMEKASILENENQRLEEQVSQRTAELVAQNIELELEASLEKVRSRSLAMQKSDELREVVAVVFNQMQQIGFKLYLCNILLFDKETSEADYWLSFNEQKIFPESYHIPYFDHPFYQYQLNTWRNAKAFEEFEMSGELKKSWDDIILNHTDVKKISDPIKNIIPEIETIVISSVATNHGLVQVISPEHLVPNQISILQRFTQVFDQCYTRFLDLKKAEDQIREAQIQAALEKIRSRSLGMHHSAELENVVETLFHELVGLGVAMDGALIFVFNRENRNINLWIATDQLPQPVNIDLPYDESFEKNNILVELWTALRDQGAGLNKVFSDEDTYEYFRYVQKYNALKIPEDIQEIQLNRKWTLTYAAEQNTILGLDSWSGHLFKESDLNTLRRFARVFEQTFTRFLDLQKAEAQAWEAQIQLALERLRARTMAMRHSSELADVANVMYEQLSRLGAQLWICGFNICKKDSDVVEGWISPPGGTTMDTLYLPIDVDSFTTAAFQVWKNQSGIYTDIKEGLELQQDSENLMSHPSMEPARKFIIDNKPELPTWVQRFAVPFTYGFLNIVTIKPFNEKDTLIRFAKVFDQSYTRFLDLQKAEERAQAAILEASLERVRAETASMRNAADLEHITPMIWNELKALGVSFIRCGVFIIDESRQLVHTFLSTPDGKAIGSFHLPFTVNSEIKDIVSHWQKRKMYLQHWDKDAFLNWTNALIQQGYIEQGNNYSNLDIPENLHLHFIPFVQGMLYAGNIRPLHETDLKLIQNLADAFSSAYARYEDFVRLEQAKQQVDTALSELKQAQAQLIHSEKMASLGELTAGIAHEIQNPLNFVNNFSEVNRELISELQKEMEKGDINESRQLVADIASNLDKVEHHGKRADAIVKSMLEHSRNRSGNIEPTDINKLSNEYVRLAYHGEQAREKSPSAGHRGFKAVIETDFDPAVGMVPVMPQEMGRVLLNLFNNAFYAVNEKWKTASIDYQPTVTVKTKRQGGQVKIQVSDNGNGIPERIRDKIYQPFFTTKPTGQGTGLGLSLSYDIIKAHNGGIKFESMEKEGTTFTLIIPA